MYCSLKKTCSNCKKKHENNKGLRFLGYSNSLLKFSCSCGNILKVQSKLIKFFDEFFSLTEAAKELKITRQGINYYLNLKNSRRIKSTIVNGKKKIHYEDFSNFISKKNVYKES